MQKTWASLTEHCDKYFHAPLFLMFLAHSQGIKEPAKKLKNRWTDEFYTKCETRLVGDTIFQRVRKRTRVEPPPKAGKQIMSSIAGRRDASSHSHHESRRVGYAVSESSVHPVVVVRQKFHGERLLCVTPRCTTPRHLVKRNSFAQTGYQYTVN